MVSLGGKWFIARIVVWFLVSGFDPKGCEELQGHVQGTKKWIGTTEVTAVFRNLNIR